MDNLYCPNYIDNRLYIEFFKVPSGVEMDSEHYHDFYEVYFYLGNEMKYFVDNKIYNIKKYDIVFIDKFTYHRTFYKQSDSRERILATFTDTLIATLNNSEVIKDITSLFNIKKISLSEIYGKEVLETCMNKILPAFYKSDVPLYNVKSELLFLDLLLSIVEISKKEIRSVSIEEIPQQKRITEIVNYINNNYTLNITLDSLAQYFFINKYYLCHEFKKFTGSSIIDFINTRRLIETEKLLKNSNLNITEISEYAGFNNINYFIALFKRKFGYTPSVFRKKFGNINQ